MRMMRKLLPLICLLFVWGATAQAQTYPLVTVQDIQTVSGAMLSNCVDSSSYNNDTVRVQGVIVTHPDSNALTTATRAQVWMRNGYGHFSGLDVIQFFDPSANGMANLIPGDSVELTGVVTEFGGGETELIPIQGPNVTILGSGATIQPTVIPVSDLSDNSQTNQLPTGERWEGSYVEIQNVTVTSVDFFSGNTRVSFIVQDGSGNVMNISDRYLVQRLPNGSPSGNFVPPNVGDQFCHIRGVVAHSPNGCTGSGGRGYEIHPTRASDYCILSSAPSIVNVTRNLVTPTSSQTVTVSADISDGDGISSATLFYAVGVGTSNYTQVSMSLTSGTAMAGVWSADIPAQADGAFVKYYVCATDNSSNTSCNPNVPGGSDPDFYTVRDNGTTIVDVQFVPTSFGSAASGYEGLDVTVEGVVTASAEANNLGFVFIQQENELAWAGIMCTDNPALATLVIGDKVRVTGTVNESFGFTRIEQISSVQSVGTGTINPVVQDPDNFTIFDHAVSEPYEGMLIQLEHPTGPEVFVVDNNPDAPSNFAEWRVGTDQFNPNDGCRIITGRVTTSAFSSLNVSYVNDTQWETTDGVMNVSAIVVQNGDPFFAIRGVMAYTFGNFKLLPRNDNDFDLMSSVNGGIDMNVVAFPNPVRDELKLVYSIGSLQENATATVYDLMGHALKSVELHALSGEAVIDMRGMAAGNYVIRVESTTSNVIDVIKINKLR